MYADRKSGYIPEGGWRGGEEVDIGALKLTISVKRNVINKISW